MNRLILDHFRRWRRVLALCGAMEYGLGAFIAWQPKVTFEFWGLMVAMWAGANLLTIDLKNGMARGVAVLPLTTGQIGRSWWLATVGIPAIALAVPLFLGAGTVWHFHPNTVFPAERLGLAGLFNVAWLGVIFTCASGTPGFEGWGWQRVRTALFSMLAAITLLVGMIYFQNAAGNPFKRDLLLGIGALLTVESWFRAERFVTGRAGFRLDALQLKGARGQPGAADDSFRRLEAQRPPATAWWGLKRRMFDANLRRLEGMAGRNPRGGHPAPGGRGGIPLLIRTVFVRTFLTGAAMAALMTLLAKLQSGANSEVGVSMSSVISFMVVILVLFIQPTTALRHLRFLRTLPISAARLAWVMIGMLILPLIAAGALAGGVMGLAFGASAAVAILRSSLFMLAPASLCIFFIVWRGEGTQTKALLFVTLFGFYLGALFLRHGGILSSKMPCSGIGAFVALFVLLAFLLTRRTIQRSSRAYVVPANQFGNIWGPGR